MQERRLCLGRRRFGHEAKERRDKRPAERAELRREAEQHMQHVPRHESEERLVGRVGCGVPHLCGPCADFGGVLGVVRLCGPGEEQEARAVPPCLTNARVP